MGYFDRKPNRLKEYNYSTPGYYFVNINVKNGNFGEITKGKMTLNEYGKTAYNFLKDIPRHFKNTKIDKFIIMPNHIHGIIIIKNDIPGCVGNADLRSLRKRINHSHKQSAFSNRRKKFTGKNIGLSKIINQYKSSVTRQINRKGDQLPFQWQKSFYDHIIRNDTDLNRIREYIRDNPLKWELRQESQKQKRFAPHAKTC